MVRRGERKRIGRNIKEEEWEGEEDRSIGFQRDAFTPVTSLMLQFNFRCVSLFGFPNLNILIGR